MVLYQVPDAARPHPPAPELTSLQWKEMYKQKFHRELREQLCQSQEGQEALNIDWDKRLLRRGSALEVSLDSCLGVHQTVGEKTSMGVANGSRAVLWGWLILLTYEDGE